MKKSTLFIGMIVAAVATPTFADGAKLYQEKTCWSCHGKDGKKTLTKDFPKVAGQNAKYAERQMLDIKSGVRANGSSAAMKGVMDLVTEDEIKQLAEYISTLK